MEPDMIETEQLQRLYARRVASGREGVGATCVTPEAILAVVRREGPEDERLATLEHVMACAACHREYQWLKAVDQAGVESAGAGLGRTWWRGAPLAMAASIAVIVGAAVVLSGVLRSGAERERGGAGDIVLIAPGPRATGEGPLAFTWRALPGASSYVLEIQRPDGSIALADTTADTVAAFTEPGGRLLPDSAYRWWVREVTDGSEPRSSAFRDLRLTGR
jgi:hypothetical protein